jgi:hypothetical protein
MMTDPKATEPQTFDTVIKDCYGHASVALNVLDRLLSAEASATSAGDVNLLPALEELLATLRLIRNRAEDLESRLGKPL